MPFDLSVTFSGMCLLVNDAGSGRIHALLPHVGHHHPEHLARLIYRAGHERGDGSADRVMKALEGRGLDLSAVASGRERSSIPSDLFDMGSIMGQKISRGLLQGDGGRKVLSRIALAPYGAMTSNKGGLWKIAGHGRQRMATSVTWTLPGVPEDLLELTLNPLTGDCAGERLTLHPIEIDGALKVELHVFHTPQDELPVGFPYDPDQTGGRRLDPGDAAPHFEAYYSLFGLPPVPRYDGPPIRPTHEAGESEPMTGSFLVCMSATAELEP